MHYLNLPSFESMEQIPEVIPSKLWLPEDSEARIIKANAATPFTTSPVEVAYGFYELGAGSFTAERQIIDLFLDDIVEVPDDFLQDHWGNHMGRVVLKAALDPDRFAPLDLVLAYCREISFRGHNPDEELYFSNYVANWGLFKRD